MFGGLLDTRLSKSDRMTVDPQFHARYGPWAVIAGASEGIGRAYAHVLAERGFNLLTIARRREPLEKEAALLRRRHHVEVQTCTLDLSDSDLLEQTRKATAGLDIGLLVYNACYSVIGEFLEVSSQAHQSMLDVNCRAPLLMTQALAPDMIKRGHGGIILMSSMSGFQGTAMVANYAATKAWNINLAQGLWEEFQPHGVDVLACVAGATSTPGFENNTPQQRRSKAFPMAAEDVARQGLAALGKKPLHITGRINRAVDVMGNLMSRKQRTRFFSNATRSIYGDQ